MDHDENDHLFFIPDGIKVRADDDGDDEDEEKMEKLKQKYLFHGVTSSEFPEIQKYALISSANSFTQWHVDFSGSSVWYYMAEGLKYFYIITTTPQILEKFRRWHLDEKQDIWFPEYAQCTTQLVVLRKNELIIIPSGCIHCVYTPVDSIAFGGNFLCDANIEMQLRIEHLYHQVFGALFTLQIYKHNLQKNKMSKWLI